MLKTSLTYIPTRGAAQKRIKWRESRAGTPKCRIHVRTTTTHSFIYRIAPNKVPNYPVQLLFLPCNLHAFTTARKVSFFALERI